jgi:hypothetical protein
MMITRTRRLRGVTLIETVFVLIISALLLGFYANVNLGALTQVSALHRAGQIADDVRHVQQLAIAGGRMITFSVEPTRYMATCEIDPPCLITSDCGNVLMDRSRGRGLCVTIEPELRFASAQQFTFDSLGRPKTLADVDLQILANGQPLGAILIESVTGRVRFSAAK